MAEFAIRAEGLSKRYRIGVQETGRNTLGGVVIDVVRQPMTNLRRLRRLTRFRPGADEPDVIWALKGVSFEIKPGESVGIIGGNGAGKSTLLKILSRITSPTSGRALVCGRVSSLLEVGTGFHPELSGRENVYLNGAILGMTREEIRSKFDEIVEFSDVGKFIDTPVKRYSSGMRLRLAFSVAAHLEPEILMVDEVLAVGDIRFQKKCLSKMDDVAREGRTVLYVAHNMPAIARLCTRAILLDGGRVVQDGPAAEVISTYLNSGLGTSAAREWPDPATAPSGEIVRLRAVRVRNDQGEVTETVDIRRPVRVEMEYDVLKGGYIVLPNMHFFNEEGIYAFGAQDLDPEWRGRRRPPGRYVSTVWIPGNLLSEGMLFVDANMNTLEPFIFQFQCRSAVAFHVVDSLDGDSSRGDWTGPMHCVVRPMFKWTTRYLPQPATVPAGGRLA
ncbi:MAG: ATP-binding cassette domain-containing protein [Gemmatimonadetes bacterium]|nr:ATP-binding cassette domain-containing protein [Gemmatimonadota bacterium]